MSEPKWTKGPLEVLADGDEVSSVIVGQASEPFNDIAEFLHKERHTVDVTRDEAIANAMLYAAASDLAEAGASLANVAEYCMKRYVSHPSDKASLRTCIKAMRAALAKAGPR